MLSNILGNNLLSAMAEQVTGSTATGAGAGELISMLLMMGIMVVVFYFFLIRPQKKKDKAVKAMLAALKVGDRVCTIGGIYGTITAVRDDNVTITVGSKENTMVMARWGIRSVEDAVTENDSDPAI